MPRRTPARRPRKTAANVADSKTCPHCRRAVPRNLFWKSIVAGQTAHQCPACRKRFRLTYRSKMRLSYLNVLLILGFIILWNLPDIPRNLAVFAVVAILTVLVMPTQVRYEKTTARYDTPTK